MEHVAIPLDDARIPDNNGNRPVDKPIVPDVPASYWSTLPVKGIVENMANSALRHLIETEFSAVIGGFIHSPYLPVQVMHRPNVPCMRLEDVQYGMEVAAASVFIIG